MPTTLSLHTLSQIVRFFRKQGLDDVRLLPFYSMVDGRKALHRQTVSDPASPECRMLATRIPHAAEVERMGLRRAPLTSYARASPAARAFRELWAEIQEHLEPAPGPAPGAARPRA